MKSLLRAWGGKLSRLDYSLRLNRYVLGERHGVLVYKKFLLSKKVKYDMEKNRYVCSIFCIEYNVLQPHNELDR